MACGGFSSGHNPTEDDCSFVSSVRSIVEAQNGHEFQNFVPLSVSTQVVAGTNYIFKIQVSSSSYIHLKIHKPLPHTHNPPVIMNLVTGVGLDDAIVFWSIKFTNMKCDIFGVVFDGFVTLSPAGF